MSKAPKEIQRYTINAGWNGWDSVRDNEGDFVYYDVHKSVVDELQAKNKELKQRLNNIKQAHKAMLKKCIEAGIVDLS